jgi:multimeric flavodoxin WrbA
MHQRTGRTSRRSHCCPLGSKLRLLWLSVGIWVWHSGDGNDGGVLSSPGRRALLVVHHTTSPSLQAMLEAVLDGAQTEEIEDVDVRVRPALAATAVDVLSADAFLLGTSANIGYMSGALKHFFDQIYYPCLTAKVGAGYGVYIHGNSDTEGALRAIRSIVQGLGWVVVHEPVTVLGTPSRADLEACWDLGATTAATLMPT